MLHCFALGFLPKLVETRLEEWIEESECVNIFVAGQTGTGKSTLVNGLVGREVSREGKTLDPGTKSVCEYLCKVDDIFSSAFGTHLVSMMDMVEMINTSEI